MTSARASQHHLARKALQADQAEARCAVRATLLDAAQADCEACGERIPPDEREAAPRAIHCAACRCGLAFNTTALSR